MSLVYFTSCVKRCSCLPVCLIYKKNKNKISKWPASELYYGTNLFCRQHHWSHWVSACQLSWGISLIAGSSSEWPVEHCVSLLRNTPNIRGAWGRVFCPYAIQHGKIWLCYEGGKLLSHTESMTCLLKVQDVYNVLWFFCSVTQSGSPWPGIKTIWKSIHLSTFLICNVYAYTHLMVAGVLNAHP